MVGVAAAFFNYETYGPSNSNAKSTFSQYGFTMQYPTGAKFNSSGTYGGTANSGGGEVSWNWDNGNSLLTVVWINGSGYNYTSAFQGTVQNMQKYFSNVSTIDSGNVTVNNQIWQYQTYEFTANGNIFYSSEAINFYQSEGRAYLIQYTNPNSGTLSALEAWIETFRG